MPTDTRSHVNQPPAPITVIESSKPSSDLPLRHLWKYRGLLLFPGRRDAQVPYNQTALGVAWAILQSLLATFIFSIFFGRLAKMRSDALPYPLLAYIALAPWHYFANALPESSNSLVASQMLIKRVYFPRLIIPVDSVAAGWNALAWGYRQ